MPKIKTDRSKNYVGVDSDRANGKLTKMFVLKRDYGSCISDDTYVLFRVYKRKLSKNDKAAGFPDTTNYSVADMFTRIRTTAVRRARAIIVEKFGKGMGLTVKDED